MSYLKSFTPLTQACSLCPIQNSKYTLWQTFRVCQSFLYATYTLHLRKAAACAQFKIHNSKFKIHPLANSESLPKFFIPQFIIQNSQFKIHNSPNSHCKIFAKVGKIPPPIVKIMLNFTIHNVKILFLDISLIHQLTTPKVQRRMSEGLAKDNPPTHSALHRSCPKSL